MNEFLDEFRWCWLGIILGMFMYISLMVWGCVCKELAAPVPKAMEGREEFVLEREQRHDEYINSRRDVIVYDKMEVRD